MKDEKLVSREIRSPTVALYPVLGVTSPGARCEMADRRATTVEEIEECNLPSSRHARAHITSDVAAHASMGRLRSVLGPRIAMDVDDGGASTDQAPGLLSPDLRTVTRVSAAQFGTCCSP